MTLSNNFPILPFSRALLATILVLLLFCATRCTTPERKLSKLLTKYPELIQKDSVHTRDTIVSPGVTSETRNVLPENTRDTITIHDTIHNVTTKYVRLPGDSIYINTQCPGDTIFIDKIRVVEKYITAEPWYKQIFSFIPWYVDLIIILILIAFILSKILK